MGGGGSQTTKTDPWKATQPYWKESFGDIFGTPATEEKRQWVPDGTMGVGGFSGGGFRGARGPIGHWETTPGTPGTPGFLQEQLDNPNPYISQGWDMVANAANDPSNTAMLTGARDYANRVLGGDFLDPTQNRALAMQLQRGMEDMGAFDSSAEASGRYGGGAWAQMRGRNLADLQGNLYGQGLQQMTQMSALAPQIYQNQYLPSQVITALGKEQEARPWELYSRALQMLQGASGGTSTTTAGGGSPMMGALGGAAVGSMLGPWGIPLGAAAGYFGSK